MPEPAQVAGAGAAPMTPAMPQQPGRNIDPISIDACASGGMGGVGAADIQKLMAGGPAGTLRMLYPYDGTVFPRGMLPPTIMWDGLKGATAVYVRIKGPRFEYKGCVVPTGPDQSTLPVDVWTAAGEKTFGPIDPYVVELTVLANGTVAGPITAKWTIAQATIKGSIYYNSYSSMLSAPGGGAPGFPGAGFPGGFPGGGFPGGGGSNGIVLRIPPGGKAEAFVSVQCNGCHSVSANGSRLISVIPGAGGQSYVLEQKAAANPPGMPAGASAAYGALYPDGSVYLSTSLATDVARASFLSAAGATTNATLFRTDDGTMVPSKGIPTGALMPNFSPDGTVLAFNDFAISQAHGLAVMKYDNQTHTASDYKAVYKDDSMRPGWPFVLPDNGGVLFARTDSVEFSGEGAGLALAAPGIPSQAGGGGPKSDLYIVDIASGTSTLLAKAMGYLTPEAAAMEKTYLPFGAAELHKSYYPTLSPVAAGGYFWIFFDAVRHYGNLGQQRQLWGAAVEIAPDGKYTTDRSHPAFYVPGQEFGTGNHRAFAALDPCKKTGDTCTSGTDCCGGFCFVKDPMVEFAEPMGTCTDKPKECSNTNERCTIDADCCPPPPGQERNMCIAGFCAMLLRPL